MARVWSLEFLNSNSQRAYPLFEDATARDISGDFLLPTDFLLGLYFATHINLNIDPYQIFLRRVAIHGAGFTISLGYDDGTTNPPIIASTTVPRATHQEYDVYTLTGAGDFFDSTGFVVIGKLENISQFAGAYLFDYDGGQLDPDCIRPMIRGVTSLTVRNGTELSDPIQGDIELVAGTNVSLEINQETRQITINAIDGEGLNTECDCPNDDREAEPVRTLSGVEPDISGNINLLGGDCITIEAAEAQLTINDVCSKPCCGADELVIVTNRLEQLAVKAETVRAFVETLALAQNQMIPMILGSRLRDSGCITCE